MKNKGSITQEDFKILDELKSNPEVLGTWLNRIRAEEPEICEWQYKNAGLSIAELGQRIPGLPIEACQLVAHGFLLAFIAGWVLYMKHSDDALGEIMKELSPDEQFKIWLEGKADPEMYDYTLKGLAKDSTKYKALMAYRNLREKNKELKEFKKHTEKAKRAAKNG